MSFPVSGPFSFQCPGNQKVGEGLMRCKIAGIPQEVLSTTPSPACHLPTSGYISARLSAPHWTMTLLWLKSPPLLRLVAGNIAYIDRYQLNKSVYKLDGVALLVAEHTRWTNQQNCLQGSPWFRLVCYSKNHEGNSELGASDGSEDGFSANCRGVAHSGAQWALSAVTAAVGWGAQWQTLPGGSSVENSWYFSGKS